MNYFYAFLTVLVCSFSFSQKKCSNITKIDLQQVEKITQLKDEVQKAFLMQKFPVNKLNNVLYLSVLAKSGANFQQEEFINNGIIIGSKINQILSLKVPLSALSKLENLESITYFEIAGKISPSMDKAIKDIRADSVHMGFDLPEAYTGKDVYIGITDWGFDYTHPNFYDTSLTQTRIVAAWDQYKQSGPSPAGFTYGTEFSGQSELLAAQSDTANIYSYNYHGSHVAGICGGSGAGTVYRGVAFEANYLFATFLVDAASVIDAYEWMYQKAQAAGKRLVINQSWGLHWIGNLDGTSLLSQAIDSYSDLGVVFVSSGGNNGDVNFHLKKTFVDEEIRSRVLFYSYGANPNMWGQSLSLWGEAGKNFDVGFQVLNTTNTILAETPYYNTNTQANYLDSTLRIADDTVFFNLSCEAANPQNNRPHVRLRIKNTHVQYKIFMKVRALDGTVHAWNVTELTNDVGNWGMGFAISGAGTLGGNREYGISDPASANSTIAVAAHASEYENTQGNLIGGEIASFSSFGPTLDERTKPDISAPGVSVGSSVSSFTDASYSSVGSVSFNGRTYHFTKISGTSMAGPMVTGVVALILDANPYLTPAQVKEIIQITARTDDNTGIIPAIGSYQWGFGKINAYQAIKLALATLGTLETAESQLEKFILYPNPTTDLMKLDFEGEISENLVSIYDNLGKEVNLAVTNKQISISDLPAGSYILKFISKGKVYQQKFIKE
jgi:minor extracellular serine protease Vpr